MKAVVVKTHLDAEDTENGQPFDGSRSFPFPESLDSQDVQEWEQEYAAMAKQKGWTTQPDLLADAETGMRIRVGKEIREKARSTVGKKVEKAATTRAAEPTGVEM